MKKLIISGLKVSFALAFIPFLISCSGINTDTIDASDYRIYYGDGRVATFDDLLQAAQDTQVTFLGEVHDDAVAHYLEALIFESLLQADLVLSLEMFESDVQYVVDEYLADLIREDHLMSSGRAWGNYEADYKRLIEFAKENAIPVIAANAPRRYVNRVSRMGAESLLDLSEQAKQYLPPLPYATASEVYKEKFYKVMEVNGRQVESSNEEAAELSEPVVTDTSDDQDVVSSETSEDKENDEDSSAKFNIARTLQAQSLWDSSMAWSIAQFISKNPNAHVLQINGGFHSAEGLGILEHLRAYNSQLSTLVITMIPGEQFPAFDSEQMSGQGDFIIVTDSFK